MDTGGRTGGHGFAEPGQVRTIGRRLAARPEGIQGKRNQVYKVGIRLGAGSLKHHPSLESHPDMREEIVNRSLNKDQTIEILGSIAKVSVSNPYEFKLS